jgi:hypothetical protein
VKVFCKSLPSDLKEGCKGVRVWGVGEDTFFMPGGETCFIGTAFCLLPSALCPLPFFVMRNEKEKIPITNHQLLILKKIF